MGLKEKLKNAKPTSWLTDGIDDDEAKVIQKLALISADIQKCRSSSNLPRDEFNSLFKVILDEDILGVDEEESL